MVGQKIIEIEILELHAALMPARLTAVKIALALQKIGGQGVLRTNTLAALTPVQPLFNFSLKSLDLNYTAFRNCLATFIPLRYIAPAESMKVDDENPWLSTL